MKADTGRKTDHPNYAQVHYWIRKNYGKANRCENKDCQNTNATVFHWALRHGYTYEKKRNNFKMLCCSCHRKYDDTPLTRYRKSVGHKGQVPINKESVCNSAGEVFESLTAAAKAYNTTASAIHNAMNGLSNTCAGLKWEYKK